MDATRRLGYGLTLLLLGGTVANGQQFGELRGNPPVSRPAPSAAAASGFQPVSGTQPGTHGFTPAGGAPAAQPGAAPRAPAPNPELDKLIPSELANHPLALKPEHGAYVICVRSYSRPAWVQNGPTALSLAEGLANEIRTTHRAPAYLFEHISEEKRAEFARREAARQEQAPFLNKLQEIRLRAEQQGSTFLDPEDGRYTYRYKTVRYNDQFAVIIAGFRTDEDARKALDVVRKWPMPKNLGLLDAGIIEKSKGGKSGVEQAFINPYGQAFVVPNPTIAKTAPAPKSGVDEFTAKLNEDRPYNLLKVRKPWTLAVKQFSAPASLQGKEIENGADVLRASAEMAEQLATMLRAMKNRTGQAKGEEAFVLHTRTGSLVTVGQFDGPDDPRLLQTRRRLMEMNFTISEQQNVPGRPLNPQERLFSDNILPIPVPR